MARRRGTKWLVLERAVAHLIPGYAVRPIHAIASRIIRADKSHRAPRINESQTSQEEYKSAVSAGGGWGGRIRTFNLLIQSQLRYRCATPQGRYRV